MDLCAFQDPFGGNYCICGGALWPFHLAQTRGVNGLDRRRHWHHSIPRKGGGFGAGRQPRSPVLLRSHQGRGSHLEELTAIADEKPALHLHLIESTVTDRLEAATIVQASGANLPRTHVYFCGPIAMRDSLQQGLSALGLRPSRFHFEHFEIRSGIGIRKLAEALLEIVLRKTRKVPNA